MEHQDQAYKIITGENPQKSKLHEIQILLKQHVIYLNITPVATNKNVFNCKQGVDEVQAFIK